MRRDSVICTAFTFSAPILLLSSFSRTAVANIWTILDKKKSEIRVQMHSYTTEAFKIAHQRYTLTCPCFICSFQRLAGAKTFYQAQESQSCTRNCRQRFSWFGMSVVLYDKFVINCLKQAHADRLWGIFGKILLIQVMLFARIKPGVTPCSSSSLVC